MGIEIRRVRPGEYEEAGEATALAYRRFVTSPEDWNGYLRRLADVGARADKTLVLGAVLEGRVVGTVTVETEERVPGSRDRPPLDPDEMHVRMLAVHPDFQGRGIGRALMDAVVEEARRRGRSRITLDTTEAMKEAVGLYESMGFERGEDLVYDDGFRLRWYELRLDEG
ncbi:MAG TPA: GNAT family N-acetyltransferase [Actinomycetota bacterium]|nr:GNAT family N-acetyltransferase [Actinomycetota bacterium]